jgi:hypothetical protein
MRSPLRLEIIVLVLVAAGCTSTTATPLPSVASAATADIASAAPTASAKASPSATPAPTPAVSPLAADFTTPAIGSTQAAWTGITWTLIAAGDPLGTVTGMVAAPSGGYVAWANPVAVGSTASASPVWSSTDGATWNALPADTFGPAGAVIAIGGAGGNLVALTLTGGPNTCGDDAHLFCWTLQGPIQVWTSTDGVAWSPAPGPTVTLAEDCTGCGVEVPIVAFGTPGAILAAPTAPKGVPSTLQIATSADGSSWTAAPTGAIPPRSASVESRATVTGSSPSATTARTPPAPTSPIRPTVWPGRCTASLGRTQRRRTRRAGMPTSPPTASSSRAPRWTRPA